jgi:hypothetical protein
LITEKVPSIVFGAVKKLNSNALDATGLCRFRRIFAMIAGISWKNLSPFLIHCCRKIASENT